MSVSTLQPEFIRPAPANPYYPDKQLFLLLIPLINSINYYLTYPDIGWNGYFLLTFTIDTLQGYLAWYAVRKIILYLDKKIPYEKAVKKRLFLQLFVTTFTGLMLIALTTEMISWLVKGRQAPLHFYTRDLVIIGIWFLVINGIYIGLYYYRRWLSSENYLQSEQEKQKNGLLVKTGKQDLLLNYSDLTGFQVDGNYIMVRDREGKRYYLDQSLDKIEQMTPTAGFFRLNRQYLLARDSIRGYKRIENGKLEVMINTDGVFPKSVIVSRLKAAAFRRWFKP